MYVLLLFFFVDFDYSEKKMDREMRDDRNNTRRRRGKKKREKKDTSLSLSLSLSFCKRKRAFIKKHTQRSTTAHRSLSKVKATRRIEKTGNIHTHLRYHHHHQQQQQPH